MYGNIIVKLFGINQLDKSQGNVNFIFNVYQFGIIKIGNFKQDLCVFIFEQLDYLYCIEQELKVDIILDKCFNFNLLVKIIWNGDINI